MYFRTAHTSRGVAEGDGRVAADERRRAGDPVFDLGQA